jgi:type I restriction enzyme S subunit
MKGIYAKVVTNFSEYNTLSTICKIQKGQQVNGEELSEYGEYYVMNGGIEPSGYYDKYNTLPNTISISEGGNSCGYVQFNTVPFWSGGHCYSLQDIDIEYSTHFVYHYLKSKEKEIMALRIGSGLPNIQKKDLEKFLIPVLSLETQKTIVNGINKIETKLKHEKDILSAYQTQKAYLLRNLFI